MEKELGPMAKLHYGPDNKALGNGKNNTNSEDMGKIAQSMASAGIAGAVGSAVGKSLPKNSYVSTGTCTPAIPIKKGDEVMADFGKLGNVSFIYN